MAKQYVELYADVCSFDNLALAFQKAAKGKRGNPEVAGFEFSLEPNLWALHRELTELRYHPGAYRSFYIRDPKLRLISAAPFRDRVVHHALCNVTEPLFDRSFIGDSYANRVGKGSHAALDRAQAFSRRYKFVLQCDIQQFFPAVDHACMKALFRRKIGDPLVVWLADRIIDNGAGVLRDEYRMSYYPGDELFAIDRPRGLPIGNLTSQLWANIYPGRQIPASSDRGRRHGEKPASSGPGRVRHWRPAKYGNAPGPASAMHGAGALFLFVVVAPASEPGGRAAKTWVPRRSLGTSGMVIVIVSLAH
jgi:hypothetical protein